MRKARLGGSSPRIGGSPVGRELTDSGTGLAQSCAPATAVIDNPFARPLLHNLHAWATVLPSAGNEKT